MSADGPAPEHDPLAEEMDLITFQEADARLYREIVRTQTIVDDLRISEGEQDAELLAQQRRLTALKGVAARLSAQRTQPPLR